MSDVAVDAKDPTILFNPNKNSSTVGVREADHDVGKSFGRNSKTLAIEPVVFCFGDDQRVIVFKQLPLSETNAVVRHLSEFLRRRTV